MDARAWLATLLIVSAPAAFAQEVPTPAPLSLGIEDALRLAQKTSEDVLVAKAGLDRADAQVLQARSEWYPQLSGSLAYERLLASEWEGLFEAPPGSEETGFSELPFGQKNTWRAGLSFSQNVYAGGRTVARTALARAAERTAELGLSSARASVVLATAQAYYDAVLADRLLVIAEASLKQAEQTLEQIRLGHQQGARPEFDLLRAQVTYENQRPQVVQARIDRDLSGLRLKQLLELPLDRPLVLTSQLEEGQLADLTTPARQLAEIPEEPVVRAPVQQALEAVRMQEAAERLAFSGHLPQLNVVSSYGWVTYPDTLFPSRDDWRNNWTVGVQLLVPLFSGFRVTGDVRAAKADVLEARARAQQAEEQGRLDSRSAHDQLQAARALWEATAGTVKQAERAYQIAELRYREGISTQLELTDSRLLLQQANANRARAARDLQIARVRVALLPYLPLGAGTAGGAALVSGGAPLTSTAAAQQQGTGAQGQPQPGAQPSSQPGAGGGTF